MNPWALRLFGIWCSGTFDIIKHNNPDKPLGTIVQSTHFVIAVRFAITRPFLVLRNYSISYGL